MSRGNDDEPRSAEWVIRIKEYLRQSLDSDKKSSWTIDEVPSNWRGVHKDAFDPEMIRIGPFPRKDRTRLRVMEEHKWRFLRRLLEGKLERWRRDGDMSRTTEGERMSNEREREEDNDGGGMAKGVLLDNLGKAISMLKQKTLACYSTKYHVGRFPERMVLDGCFLVELLRIYYDLFHKKLPEKAIEDDPIFTNPHILATLRRDLLLLENQLPFFLLEKLYELINNENNIQQAVPLEELAVTFFNPLLPQLNGASKSDSEETKGHLLEVFRSAYLKLVGKNVHNKGKNQAKSRLDSDGSIRGLFPHFASELEETGVHFKKWKGHDLLDIEFSHDTLWVPPLSINNHTISLFLNLVAYELSVKHPKPFFTNYIMFWNSLVNSPRDIQIFRKHGIIGHLGRDEDLANLLIRCREVTYTYDLDLGYLCKDIKKVNRYCEQYYDNKYSVWWRSLIRERFSSPWTCISLFAAIILLLLAALQTIYTVYPYYRPH